MINTTSKPTGDHMILTTTLNRLKAGGACASRYAYLLNFLGGPSIDHNEPINLLTILEHNGPEDCLWALRATEQNCEVVARLIAADCAKLALHIWGHKYPNDPWPRHATWVAAWDAAWTAAWDAAWAAAGAATEYAAWTAARAAAWNAVNNIIRKYLEASYD